jgi:hypothetical protein
MKRKKLLYIRVVLRICFFLSLLDPDLDSFIYSWRYIEGTEIKACKIIYLNIFFMNLFIFGQTVDEHKKMLRCQTIEILFSNTDWSLIARIIVTYKTCHLWRLTDGKIGVMIAMIVKEYRRFPFGCLWMLPVSKRYVPEALVYFIGIRPSFTFGL